jgi:hypothetical protein
MKSEGVMNKENLDRNIGKRDWHKRAGRSSLLTTSEREVLNIKREMSK